MAQLLPQFQILENLNGFQEENFLGYAARILVCAQKTYTC